jgi:hypothetical protein
MVNYLIYKSIIGKFHQISNENEHLENSVGFILVSQKWSIFGTRSGEFKKGRHTLPSHKSRDTCPADRIHKNNEFFQTARAR